MEQLYSELSENFCFSSLCEEITYSDDGCLTFVPKQGFHKNPNNPNKEIYEIKKSHNGYIITDNGITYSNLDHIFELNEPDVIKNITTILRQTKIKWYGNEFIYEINLNEKLYPQILYYLQGINFLYAMKVFYV
jgi:hypothetical protein